MQSDKGEIVVGQGCDPYPSYAQRGTFPIIEDASAAMLEVFPSFRRLKLLRHWAGMLDMVYDGSPVISRTDLKGFYVDLAGSGGFKTTPAAAKTFAHLIANNEPHPLAAEYELNRFNSGRLIPEGGVSANR
jgi:sarcosine oxidase subunit beta